MLAAGADKDARDVRGRRVGRGCRDGGGGADGFRVGAVAGRGLRAGHRRLGLGRRYRRAVAAVRPGTQCRRPTQGGG